MKNVLEEIFVNITSRSILSELNSSINTEGIKVNGNKQIVLTIINEDSKIITVRGKGETVERAILNALTLFHERKNSLDKPEAIKLDIITNVASLEKSDKKIDLLDLKVPYQFNIDGIAIGSDLSIIFLPSEITGYGIIKKGKIELRQAVKALRTRLISEMGNIVSVLEKEHFDIMKLDTDSFYYDGKSFVNVTNGRRLFTNLTKGDLWEAIQLTKDNYFKNVVQSSGKFIYSFLPDLNKREKRYNILRHAGTVYSMVETYELMPDKKLLEEIKQTIEYLIGKVKPWEVNSKKVKVVVERDTMKVGGNALAIVALAKYTEVTKDQSYVPLMQELASWFGEIKKENGDFLVYKQTYSTGEMSSFISGFYPGESILSLTRLYQIDKNEQWLDVAEDTAQYLINIRDKGKTHDTIAADHWLLYALNDLYRYRKKDIYLNHSFFIAEAIMRKQIVDSKQNEKYLIGSYRTDSGRSMGSTPVACRSEGLGATYRLAKDYGYNEIADKIIESIKLGVQYQLQMQFRPETVMYFKRPNLVLGAVNANLRKYQLQNDYTQHNISSFISLYNLMS